ncbi:hypothetical protein ELP57_41315, partial [Klebsiella pneumoniae]|nr:hypothetical protein [Klebsiella pneumoniae]
MCIRDRAVTEQRRRQGRTLSAWPYATAFFRCLNGSRRISLTDLRFFAPALTKEEFCLLYTSDAADEARSVDL